jgi:rhomboid protease GluP
MTTEIERQHPTEHEIVEASTAPDQSTAVEAVARKSPSLLDAPATYLLLFINILWFAVMIRWGSYIPLWRHHQYLSIFTSNFDWNVLQFFGGCDGVDVLIKGQWYRVLTATFVHMNPLHLLVNMWCLWNLGLLGEPLLGRRGLFVVYLLTGMAGNLCSLAFSPGEMVVGASGAVFGIAGILIVLLSNKKLSLPWSELRALRRSVVLFALLNLLIGMAPQIILRLAPARDFDHLANYLGPLTHIDNMAHLGGLVCGLLMGLPLFPRMLVGRTGYRARQRITFAWTAFVMALFAYGIAKFRAK